MRCHSHPIALLYASAVSPESVEEPGRGSDSGSNPDSGVPFLVSFDQRSLSAEGKKCKLECKLSSEHNSTCMSDLVLAFTLEDLQYISHCEPKD